MWSRTRWTRVRRAAGRTPRRGTRRCARGNRTKAVWRRGCAARGRSARRRTGYIRPARCGIRPIRTVRFLTRTRCPCGPHFPPRPRIRRGPRNPPSPVRAGWTTGCSSPSMPANESDAAAVTSLNLRSSLSSSARNPAESIVNGVRMVCSFLSVSCCVSARAVTSSGGRRAWMPHSHASRAHTTARVKNVDKWTTLRPSTTAMPTVDKGARSGFFQPVFRLVICFLAYSSIF